MFEVGARPLRTGLSLRFFYILPENREDVYQEAPVYYGIKDLVTVHCNIVAVTVQFSRYLGFSRAGKEHQTGKRKNPGNAWAYGVEVVLPGLQAM